MSTATTEPAQPTREQAITMIRERVRRTVDLLAEPGSVVEVRIIRAKKNTVDGQFRISTVYGYFDDFDKLARLVAEVDLDKAPPAIYLTLNAVDPSLLARAWNRLAFCEEKDTTTPDHLIVRGRWLLIDFDAKRPAKISATEGEHEAAHRAAVACREWLAELGWPAPVYADSGNGAHLLYRIDEPSEDAVTALIVGCLQAVQERFGKDGIAVDQTVSNPSRITKLYGTFTRKGDNFRRGNAATDRPHRRSKLIDVPEVVQVATREQLAQLAALAPAPAKPTASGKPTGSKAGSAGNGGSAARTAGAFDVARYLADHGIAVESESSWKGTGRMWVLERCRWNPEHTDKGAFVGLQPGGAVVAGCKHDSCAGKGWHDFRDAVEPGWRDHRGSAGRFEVKGNRTFFLQVERTKNGEVVTPVPLADFTAQIVEDVVTDDGAERSRVYSIEGTAVGGARLEPIRVPAADFQNVKTWSAKWGHRACVRSGASTGDRLREAIQTMSRPVDRLVYQHTGWRQLDGQWCYLHGGGAVGGDAQVELAGALGRVVLPASAVDVRGAVDLSLTQLELAPKAVTVPLLCAVATAPLSRWVRPCLTVWVCGRTGTRKSTLTALSQSHWGSFTTDSLPIGWSSTFTALEAAMFHLADCLVVVDDAPPAKSAREQADLDKRVEQVLRAVGNGVGKQRSNPQLTMRQDRPPRGLLVSSAEDVPPGTASILGRVVLVRIEPGVVNLKLLSQLQAQQARLPHAMLGYLEWLRPQIDSIAERIGDEVAGERDRLLPILGSEAHPRAPSNIAKLVVGLRYYLRFAVAAGVLTEKLMGAVLGQAEEAMASGATGQAKINQHTRPGRMFLDALAVLLDQGRTRLASGKQTPLDDCEIKAPRPPAVGWSDGTHVYLVPELAFREVAGHFKATDDRMPVRSAHSLGQALKDEGLIAKADDGRATCNERFPEGKRRVYVIEAAKLWQEDDEGKAPGEEAPRAA